MLGGKVTNTKTSWPAVKIHRLADWDIWGGGKLLPPSRTLLLAPKVQELINIFNFVCSPHSPITKRQPALSVKMPGLCGSSVKGCHLLQGTAICSSTTFCLRKTNTSAFASVLPLCRPSGAGELEGKPGQGHGGGEQGGWGLKGDGTQRRKTVLRHVTSC